MRCMLKGLEKEGMWYGYGSKRCGMEGRMGVAPRCMRGRWLNLFVVMQCSSFLVNFVTTLLCGCVSLVQPLQTG